MCRKREAYPKPRQRSAPETFAQRLKRLRIEAGLTQAELAEQSGLSQPFISEMESRKKNGQAIRSSRPSAETLEELAKVLGSGSLAIWDGATW